MSIEYSRLNSIDEELIRQIVIIHENIPSEWREDYHASDAHIQCRVEMLMDKVTNPKFYLLIAQTDSGTLVGYHWLEIKEKNGMMIGYIISLWVAQEYRNQGIGRAMKEHGEKWAKEEGAAELHTEVSYTNKKMIEYNMKLGFEPRQVIMTKDLI